MEAKPQEDETVGKSRRRLVAADGRREKIRRRCQTTRPRCDALAPGACAFILLSPVPQRGAHFEILGNFSCNQRKSHRGDLFENESTYLGFYLLTRLTCCWSDEKWVNTADALWFNNIPQEQYDVAPPFRSMEMFTEASGAPPRWSVSFWIGCRNVSMRWWRSNGVDVKLNFDLFWS